MKRHPLPPPRYWYELVSPPWYSRVLAFLYGALVALRRGLYRAGWLRCHHLPVPVIVIGNLTAGGSGKTPLTIALVEYLREAGFHPGVVSRGYGGAARGPLLLADQHPPSLVGDEPYLIHRRTGVPVAIGAGRVEAARLLLEPEVGVDLILADDGLQHYALARDLELCVIDGTRRFGNAQLLPAGPLREPLSRLPSVDFRICNGGRCPPDEVPMSVRAEVPYPLLAPVRAGQQLEPGLAVHAVAGIGNPVRFFASLRTLGWQPVEHPFPDHHVFTRDDFRFDDGQKPLLMTEKDAVKCAAWAQSNWWVLPIRAVLPQSFLQTLLERLQQIQAQPLP